MTKEFAGMPAKWFTNSSAVHSCLWTYQQRILACEVCSILFSLHSPL